MFTLNNPAKPYPEFNEQIHQYLTYQLEVGDSGTPHLQGVVQFQEKKTLKAVRQSISEKAHFEVMMASDEEDAIHYCHKEEGRLDGPWVYGVPLKKGSNKRKRKRLLQEFEDDPDELKVRDPDAFNRVKMMKFNEDFNASDDFQLDKLDREWQRVLLDELKGEPNDRTIHWVCDAVGAAGKTILGRGMCSATLWIFTGY